MTRDQIIETRQALVSQLPVTGEMLRGSLPETLLGTFAAARIPELDPENETGG